MFKKIFVVFTLLLLVSCARNNSFKRSQDTIAAIKAGQVETKGNIFFFTTNVNDEYFESAGLNDPLETEYIKDSRNIMMCLFGQNTPEDDIKKTPLKCNVHNIYFRKKNPDIHALPIPVQSFPLEGFGYYRTVGEGNMHYSHLLRFFRYKEPFMIRAENPGEKVYLGHFDIRVYEDLEKEVPLIEVKHLDKFAEFAQEIGEQSVKMNNIINISDKVAPIAKQEMLPNPEDREQQVTTTFVYVPR